MPDNLGNIGRLREIVDEDSFNEMLKLAKAIIHISVNWSGYERVSRSIIHQILNDLKITEIPFFTIDCSKQENKYVEDWLNHLPGSLKFLYSNGYGETLLVNYGHVADYIKYPGELGIEKTKIKIVQWLI